MRTTSKKTIKNRDEGADIAPGILFSRPNGPLLDPDDEHDANVTLGLALFGSVCKKLGLVLMQDRRHGGSWIVLNRVYK